MPIPTGPSISGVRRVFIAVGIAVCVAAIGLVALSPAAPQSVRAPLPGGGDVHIVSTKVGSNLVLSLEPRWKQLLRRSLPDSWEAPLGKLQQHTNRAQHESLLVLLRESDTNGHPVVQFSLRSPLAVFDGEFSAPGTLTVLGQGQAALCFPVYPRDRDQFEFRLSQNKEPITLTLRNPRPTKPGEWQGSSLPQTNHTIATSITLFQRGWAPARKGDTVSTSISMGMATAATGAAPMGWRRASYAVWDRLGNQMGQGWFNPNVNPAFSTNTMELKVELRIEEYLSAGFVPTDPVESWQPLAINLRARELGVRLAAVVQPGRYRVTDDGNWTRTGEAAERRELLLSPDGGTEWTADLDASVPGIIVLAEQLAAGEIFQARLRERIDPDRGKIFYHRTILSVTNSSAGRTYVAGFFSHVDPHAFASRTTNRRGLPDSTQPRLEAELIVLHPTAEFLVRTRTESQLAEAVHPAE